MAQAKELRPTARSQSKREIRAKKPSLTLNLGTNGLKVTSEPPPMAGQAGCLQGQDRSAVTHPSSRQARRARTALNYFERMPQLKKFSPHAAEH
ncbi:hypothetical protein J6590_047031 [Homalodisca vitripennis]|nr:hypothetical protein J6590_047031 [Homalodisca vitripennis]